MKQTVHTINFTGQCELVHIALPNHGRHLEIIRIGEQFTEEDSLWQFYESHELSDLSPISDIFGGENNYNILEIENKKRHLWLKLVSKGTETTGFFRFLIRSK